MSLKSEYTVKLPSGEIVSFDIGNDGLISSYGWPANTSGNESVDRLIFLSYLAFRSGDKIPRSGAGLCGVFPYNPNSPFLARPIETDTIHAASSIALATCFFKAYPDYFTLEQQLRIVNVLTIHDLGETTDIPDDGSKDKEEKFLHELTEICKKFQHLNPQERDKLLRDYIIFAHADDPIWSEEDRRVMQFAKLCDKADAILSAFCYELDCRGGSLLTKENMYGGLTKQDKFYVDETGSFRPGDVFTAHFIDNYNSFYYFKEMFDVILAACLYARQSNFPWLEKFLKKRKLICNFAAS
jgi:hypothetical protein